MPSPRLLAVCLVLCAAVPAVGCGNERTPVPAITGPGPRLGDNPLDDARGGYKLIAPAGWTVAGGTPPLISTISNGPVVVSIFRYPRAEALPRTKQELDRAITDLVAAAKARDATFRPVRSSRVRIDGKPAVQVRGTATVAGQVRTVRSTHVYAFGGELVVDMLAPSDRFREVDATYFRPLLRSLELRAPTA